MSTEDDKLPTDEQLSSIYKQVKQDMPAAHIDDAILAAARRETASRPHPASPFSGNWRIPASMAAVVLLSFGLVNLMDNEPMPINGYGPSAIEEADVSQPALGTVTKANEMGMVEEKRKLAKLAEKSVVEQAKRVDKKRQAAEKDASRLAYREPAMALPAVKSPPVAAADDTATGLSQDSLAKQVQDKDLNKQVARKQEQESLADTSKQFSTAAAKPHRAPAVAMDSSSLAPSTATMASRISPAPTVEAIIALRQAGQHQQAEQAADAFIRYYFGEDLDELDPMQVKLSVPEWEKFIVELRQLDREQQADSLEVLLNSREDELVPWP